MAENTNTKNNLTYGNPLTVLIKFALPFLLSSFMQTLYGMVDLFVVGLYNDASATTAVSIGSQVMHMLTVIIIGLAMGSTVKIGYCVGAKDFKTAAKTIGNSISFFVTLSLIFTVILLLCTKGIVDIMLTPIESVAQTNEYLFVCFLGIPFIVMYNIISSIFRGLGDSKTPMYFVAIACMINIILDFVFVGGLHLGALGASLATVLAQAFASVFGLFIMKKRAFGFTLKREDFLFDGQMLKDIIKVGLPIALQDGFIQISFIIITIIANSRGLIFAASVGIVEKFIGFLFLVPSAMLSAISAITAQNYGAGKKERAKLSLQYALSLVIVFGGVMCLFCQIFPETFVGIFTREVPVIKAGALYLMSYAVDCIFAGIHFVFSGYFCGIGKSGVSFVHNIISILVMRIPGAYLASVWFPDTLYPMGWAAPLGSLISAVICVGFYVWSEKREKYPNSRKSFEN